MLPTLIATRYVTPLREGGSVPAIVECDDDGLYVMKLRGAAQGIKALIAEVLAAELGRALGLPVPRAALVTLDVALGRAERDTEIRELLNASVGLNFALDYLPGSLTFDPVARPAPDPLEASRIVWFDALITNLDRTPKNPNLLTWHRRLWLIDHGAALYFHHAWDAPLERARSPFAPVRDHVLLPWASRLEEASAALSPLLTDERFDAALDAVPDEWLSHEPRFASPALHRAAYRAWLQARAQAVPLFLAEALRARAQLV
jgi:hypothetical protein